MKRTLIAVLIAAIGGGLLYAEETGKIDFAKVLCPISGKPAKEASTADYKEGKVYLCCDGCPKAFAKNPSKFAAKANWQLVQTKQFTQVACPISGKPAADGVTSKVGDVEIGVCCKGCKGKIDGADADQKLALVFQDKPFEKGFKPVAKKKESN